MISLTNNNSKNNIPSNLSFNGGNLTNFGGMVLFKELFQVLNLKERIAKYLVTDDKRRYYRYSDVDILMQFLFQILAGFDTDYVCKELKGDAYFPQILESQQLASQPTLSRFLSRANSETVEALRQINLELVQTFLQVQNMKQFIVDVDSTHFTSHGNQEGSNYNAHYRARGFHPLYAFESHTGYCLNAQLRPGNHYCSEGADHFLEPILAGFDNLVFRMDSGFASPKIYDLIEDNGENYLIKLKWNNVLGDLGDLKLPCSEDENLTILPHDAYSEKTYQANSWRHERRICQFSHRKEGELLYDVVSLVTNLEGGESEELFQLYRKRGQAENFIKEMKYGFFGDKTDSSTLIQNEVRMMISCLVYNLFVFLKSLADEEVQKLTMKRFRQFFVTIAGKCVKSARKQELKLSSLYLYKEEFSKILQGIFNLNLFLPVIYQPIDTSPFLLG